MHKVVIRVFFLLVSLIWLSGCQLFNYPAAPLASNRIPPSIAVTTFENRSGFAGEWELGQGMADLLVSELVLSRNFEVLERAQLSRILNEINMQRNDYFRAEGKVTKGRLKNARYLIRGVICDFSQISGGSLWLRVERFLVGGRAFTARVGLTLTIMDVESGRIIDSVQCEGVARAKSLYGEGSYKDVKFGGDMFFKTPIGKATASALRDGLKGIIKKIPKKNWEPVVAAVVNSKIIVNGGDNHAVKIGQVYQVRDNDRVITDPITGDAISTIPGGALAMIRVTEVSDSAASATLLKGSGVKRGQRLTLIKRR